MLRAIIPILYHYHNFFKDINSQKSINLDVCMSILNNVALYMKYVPIETQQSQWTLVIQEMETLFRQLEFVMHRNYDYSCLFTIMNNLLRLPAILSTKVSL